MERRGLFRALAGAALASVAAKATGADGGVWVRRATFTSPAAWAVRVDPDALVYDIGKSIDIQEWQGGAPLTPLAQQMKARAIGGVSRVANLVGRFDEATDYAATLTRLENALDAAHDTDCDGRSAGSAAFVPRVAPSEAPVASGRPSIAEPVAAALDALAPGIVARLR